MYRIDNATAVEALPTPAAVGPKPDSYFTKGDPSAGIPATIVDDDWANAVQEEICSVIESAGISLDKADHSQLFEAIAALIATNIAPDASTTEKGIIEIATAAEVQSGVDALRAVTPAGLSSRVASQTATGLVELATDAEAQTATDTQRALTPSNLAATVIGINQTWQVVTGSRAAATNYTNSTGRTIAINITINSNSAVFRILVDGIVAISASSPSSSMNLPIGVEVPPGSVYRFEFTVSTGTISNWSELR